MPGRSKRWVRQVQQTSNAMDLPPGIFTRSPRGIATGLLRDPDQHVGRAAGSKRYDQGNRASRIVVGLRSSRAGGKAEREIARGGGLADAPFAGGDCDDVLDAGNA